VENTISTQITYKNRIEKPLWDKIALREAVINAIVHNDYTTELPPVFEIYSDRIEITSSGGLSTIRNLEDFFDGYSKPINRELMRVFKDLELVEHLGTGLDKILNAYSQESFQIAKNFLKNVFYSSETAESLLGGVNGGVNGGINGGVNEVYKLIEENAGLKAKQIGKTLAIPLRTVQRYLKQLVDANKIVYKGAPKTGGYFTTQNQERE
jgi:predicted HTH transcriptional regulator